MHLAELKTFIERYQHHLSIGSFFVGFAIDSIILKRIDLLVSNALLLSYLTVVIVVMLMLHHAAAKPPRADFLRRIYLWLPFVGQFAFGGMFSGFLIFYSQAGSLVASWPFLLIIVCLILANEFMRTYQERLTYQLLLFFFCLFSFAIYAVPIVLGRMGDMVFELSGLVALVAFGLMLGFLFLIDRGRTRRALGSVLIGTAAIYGLVTVLYFANVLPPIPLSLKDIGVYHAVERVGGDYVARAEDTPWYARLTGVRISTTHGSSVVAYSSVFAPTKLTVNIVHHWQYYEPRDGTWVTISTIPFAIAGGRDGGYRGYSTLEPPVPGEWRVRVETVRGQLIGQEEFSVRFVDSTPHLTERILQ
jgi:hypothetical protein